MDGKQWFGIEVHSRREPRVADEFAIRGLDFFLPTRRIKRRWSDRIKILDVPLFPGYVFCRFDIADRLRVLNCPGVSRIVGAGSVAVPVDDGEIDAIKALVESHVVLTPWPYLRTGQRVRIEHGPLAGLEGLIIRAQEGSLRVVVSVTLLQRSVAAEIEREWISHLA
ncbi:MAG: transcription termination/antitermination NusG family protein [Bryobacteraceae bacterium]|jgi:transcription antitermination factor NusG